HVPAPQLLPQAPQLLGSFVMLTQRAPHLSGVAGPQAPHTPFVHVDPAAQVLPHLPQFAGSLWTSTQLPLQSCCGAAHAPPTPLDALELAPPLPELLVNKFWS